MLTREEVQTCSEVRLVAQNTRAIESQTRDSITEKQMEYYGWLANNRELAEIVVAATTHGTADLDPVELRMWLGFANATLREWENSHYQYEQGLFDAEEFEGRLENMRRLIDTPRVSFCLGARTREVRCAVRRVDRRAHQGGWRGVGGLP